MKMLAVPLVCAMLSVQSLSALGFGLDLGPFSFRLGGGVNVADPQYVKYVDRVNDSMICQAMGMRHPLQVTLTTVEKVSDEEVKEVTKVLVIEPHLLGVNENNEPVLKGNIVSNEVVREVTIKEKAPEGQSQGWFKGFFSSGKEETEINLLKVQDVQLLTDKTFEAPSSVDTAGIINVICSIIPVTKS